VIRLSTKVTPEASFVPVRLPEVVAAEWKDKVTHSELLRDDAVDFFESVAGVLGRPPTVNEFFSALATTFGEDGGFLVFDLPEDWVTWTTPDGLVGPDGGTFLSATNCSGLIHCVHVIGSGLRVDDFYSTNATQTLTCYPYTLFSYDGNPHSWGHYPGCVQGNIAAFANPRQGIFPNNTQLCSQWDPVPPLTGGKPCVRIKA
jgi:hypothetical protein